jgi:hypothetical protein
MKTKEILHDTLDIDHGLIDTFLSLFSDPKKVVTHPGQFTRPWKYATYVVTVSCLFMWFYIHWFESPGQAAFWSSPKRVLELSTGYASFYESTQPLKRLLLHALGVYLALTLLLRRQNKTPSISAVSLYLVGQSVFLQFIFQTIAVIATRQGSLTETNVIPLIGLVTNLAYMLYALMNIYNGRAQRLLVPLVIALELTFYGLASTRLQNVVYYSILNGSKLPFDLQRTVSPDSTKPANVSLRWGQPDFGQKPNEDAGRRLKAEKHHSLINQQVISDSLLFVADCFMPSGEIARITVRCYSVERLAPRWATTIFEKTNRYSPDTSEIFLRFDAVDQTVLAAYRLPNDSNATISLASINVRDGRLNYHATIQSDGDDIHIQQATLDKDFLYFCGSDRNIRRNFELGVILKIDKQNGNVKELMYSEDDSFGSSTKFKRMRVLPDKIEVLATHFYKRLFVFQSTEESVLTFTKRSP